MLEMTTLTYSLPWLAAAPRGDGHTVLVLPGFTAGDGSTLVLRRILNPMGTVDAMEFLLDKLKGTKNNGDFFDSMNA